MGDEMLVERVAERLEHKAFPHRNNATLTARAIIREVADALDEAGRDARSGQAEHYFSDVAGYLRTLAAEDPEGEDG
jgi:hypothetical protein